MAFLLGPREVAGVVPAGIVRPGHATGAAQGIDDHLGVAPHQRRGQRVGGKVAGLDHLGGVGRERAADNLGGRCSPPRFQCGCE